MRAHWVDIEPAERQVTTDQPLPRRRVPSRRGHADEPQGDDVFHHEREVLALDVRVRQRPVEVLTRSPSGLEQERGVVFGAHALGGDEPRVLEYRSCGQIQNVVNQRTATSLRNAAKFEVPTCWSFG